jgi:hypothetical protein
VFFARLDDITVHGHFIKDRIHFFVCEVDPEKVDRDQDEDREEKDREETCFKELPGLFVVGHVGGFFRGIIIGVYIPRDKKIGVVSSVVDLEPKRLDAPFGKGGAEEFFRFFVAQDRKGERQVVTRLSLRSFHKGCAV